jgi:hypothetical protein
MVDRVPDVRSRKLQTKRGGTIVFSLVSKPLFERRYKISGI